MRIRVVVLAMLLLCANRLLSQECTTKGQTPATAFPVCGASTFNQTSVPICGIHTVNVPGCSGNGAAYGDKNPFWYKFTCFTSGTLGLLITPTDLDDDYDWMLYDITGVNPNDVFTNNSLVVTGNWAGTPGTTGASAAGVAGIECGSDPAQNKPTFSKMPTLIVGHTYLLMISHYTDSQIGYKLSFGGGTAVITDPKLPKLDKALPGCGGLSVKVVMNKKMKCNSIAVNGSDFTLSPAAAPIVSASSLSCTTGFDMDTVLITFASALPPGDYTITMAKGADANTLLDNCDRNIPEGDNLSFTVVAIQPTPLDSMKAPGCAPKTIDLIFSKAIKCAAIEPDGSDFKITGPTPVTITGARGACSNGLTYTITLQLAAPIQTAGTYTIHLVTGLDGNTIIDECGQQTPAGVTLDFVTKDTVNADFNYQLFLGCKKDSITCIHPGGNGVNSWAWSFNNEGISNQQAVTFVFPTYGTKDIVLTVSNGVCTDVADDTVLLDNELKAGFILPDVLCPEDAAVFKDSSFGKIVSWNWDFSNGSTSNLQTPNPQRFNQPGNRTGGTYMIRLIVENDLHCFDTISRKLPVVFSCYIAVPSAFTPNGDGNNDYLYPLNAYKARKLEFQVFNRYGQQVFFTTNWLKKWDGTLNGDKQPSGLYVWQLSYIHTDTGKRVYQKGVTALVR